MRMVSAVYYGRDVGVRGKEIRFTNAWASTLPNNPRAESLCISARFRRRRHPSE